MFTMVLIIETPVLESKKAEALADKGQTDIYAWGLGSLVRGWMKVYRGRGCFKGRSRNLNYEDTYKHQAFSFPQGEKHCF